MIKRIFPLIVFLSAIATAFAQTKPAASDANLPPPPETKASIATAGINGKLPTLFIAGDSTAAQGAPGAIGWGRKLPAFFDTEKINVINRARGGRSSRTFVTEGLWQEILNQTKPGDVILIQFGHNDAGRVNDNSRARGSIRGLGDETESIDNMITKKFEVVRSYGWYLRKMIADARAHGATPILLSITVRNEWPDGKPERKNGRWSEWTAETARTQKAAFIDLTNIIADRYEELGREKVASFFPKDHTHTSDSGAGLNAECVIHGLNKLPQNPLAPYYSAKGKAVK
jgi:lysophospholipase L1-like esterase